MVVNCQLMSNFLWHFLTKIWKLKFEIEFGISICDASRHHTCNSNAHRRNQFETRIESKCQLSIQHFESFKVNIHERNKQRADLIIHEAKWIIFNQKSVKSISRQGFIFSYFKKMISEGGTAEIWNGSNRALFCYFFNFQTKALSLSICLLEIFWPEKNSFTFMRLFRLWTLYIWATTTSHYIPICTYSSKSIRTVIWVWWGLGGLCLPSVYYAQTAHLALNCIWNNREKWGYKV